MQDKDSLPVLVPKEVSKRLFTPWVRLLLVVFGLIFLGVTLYATDVTSWVRTSPVRSPDGEELVETATDDVGIYKEKTTDVALTKKTTFSKKVKNQGHVGDHHLPKQRKPKLSISDFPNQSSKDREPVSTTTTSYVSENGPTEDHTPPESTTTLWDEEEEEEYRFDLTTDLPIGNEKRIFLRHHMLHSSVPLPTVFHKVVTEEEIAGRDVFVIGDVHGCLDVLQALLKKAGVTPENTLIIFLGDVINKGPKNYETLTFVRGLQRRGALSVRGNHEEHVMFHWLKYQKAHAKGVSYKARQRWRFNWVQVLKEDDINYLKELPYTISIPSLNAIMVHAGIVPGQPLEAQYPINLVTIRNMLGGFDDNSMPIATAGRGVGIPWGARWAGPEHVYFAHDAYTGLQFHKYSTGIDTACYMGKKLTGLFVSGQRAGHLVQLSEVDVLTNISAEDAATPEEIISIDQLLFTERITEMEIFLRQVRASKKKPDESRSFLNRHKKHRIVPLPKTMHLTLSDEDIGDRDVFLIGDVHGCLDELLKLLEKANVTQKNSLIIFLGDVVNKGPRNLDTLAFVRGLVAEGAALSVRGNHEENVVFQWMRYKKAKARGTVYRPKKRYRYNWTQVLKKSDIKYMEQLPITISIPSVNAILVHAGMVPEIPLDAQYPANLVTIRNMLKGTDNYGMPRATSKRTIGIGWAHLWHGPQHVYFGHDALRGLQLHEYATGIDTACVMGKQLTGLFVKGPRASEMVQVQSNFAF